MTFVTADLRVKLLRTVASGHGPGPDTAAVVPRRKRRSFCEGERGAFRDQLHGRESARPPIRSDVLPIAKQADRLCADPMRRTKAFRIVLLRRDCVIEGGYQVDRRCARRFLGTLHCALQSSKNSWWLARASPIPSPFFVLIVTPLCDLDCRPPRRPVDVTADVQPQWMTGYKRPGRAVTACEHFGCRRPPSPDRHLPKSKIPQVSIGLCRSR